jgi:hypothetical protein
MGVLLEYFNRRFQFYGRKLELNFFDGKGDIVAELQGAGQEGAEADAVKAAEEIKAFAEVNGFTAPYGDALARKGIVSFGAPFMSQEWMAERAPYVWSMFPDCTFGVRSMTDYVVKRLGDRPASHAGAAFRSKPRRYGLIAPDSPWYQQCIKAGEADMRGAGVVPALTLSYKLDLNSASNQAASLIAKLRDANVTTVMCACDPLLILFATNKAQEQGYEPEWIVSGAGFVDSDDVAQLFHQDQWAHALGVSFNGSPQPLRASYGYAAYKVVRPNEEPSPIVDFLYYQMYLLAVGFQMAGPNLTPETLEAGMRAYPGGTGPRGNWRFSPGRYTPPQDAREIVWDAKRPSPLNGREGSYVDPQPGKRYRLGEWPPGEPGTVAPPAGGQSMGSGAPGRGTSATARAGRPRSPRFAATLSYPVV